MIEAQSGGVLPLHDSYEMPSSLEVELIDISPGEVPVSAVEFFKESSAIYTTEPPLELVDFDRLMKINTNDGVVSYFAQHNKIYDHIPIIDRALYIFDVAPDGTSIGYGRIYYDINDPAPIPFVAITRTEKDYLGRGYATRRLLVANVAAREVYNDVLHSDGLINEGGVGVWERLVRAGLACRYEVPPSITGWLATTRYRFIE